MILSVISKIFIYTQRVNRDFSAYQTNINLIDALIAYCKLIFSGFPFSGFFIENPLRNIIRSEIIIQFMVLAIFMFYIMFLKSIIPKIKFNVVKNKNDLFLTLPMLFFPLLIYSFSLGRQESLRWGEGYILSPIIFAGIIYLFFSLIRNFNIQFQKLYFLIIMTITFLLINITINAGVVKSTAWWMTDSNFLFLPRVLSEKSFPYIFLGKYKKTTKILSMPPYPWVSTENVSILSGDRNIIVENSWQRFGPVPEIMPENCMPNGVCAIDSRTFLYINTNNRNPFVAVADSAQIFNYIGDRNVWHNESDIFIYHARIYSPSLQECENFMAYSHKGIHEPINIYHKKKNNSIIIYNKKGFWLKALFCAK